MMLLFHTDRYLVYSEPQIERRFGDLLMLLRPGMRHTDLYDVLIEFKHLPLSKATEEVPAKQGEATTRRALTGEEIKARSNDELMALDNVKANLSKARNQLYDYRQKLIREHGEDLNLRCYAVLSMGFDRILWEEVA